jgi:chromatin modification-related protein EAF6
MGSARKATTSTPAGGRVTRGSRPGATKQKEEQTPDLTIPTTVPTTTASAKKRSAPGADTGYDPHTNELERRRLEVAQELGQVEKQIYDLETKYLEQSSAYGNAVRGYEGFLGGAQQGKKAQAIRPEERLFSWSSVHGKIR